MKKSILLGLAALAFVAAPATAQEVTYVPDCSQGQLINRNADNWFITAQGGANMLFGENDIKAAKKNRIGAQANLFAGKWISPVFGIRFGLAFDMAKGACPAGQWDQNFRQPSIDGKYYPEKWLGFGPEFDILINLTNWWCGYRPGRVYNAVLHGGANAYWRWAKNSNGNPYQPYDKSVFSKAHNTNMSANIGLQNNFRLSNVVTIFLDLQYQMLDFHELEHQAMVSAGLTFNLGKSDWNCPVTAVCPTWKYTDAEGDALVSRLNAAENQIKNLQDELDACRRRPTATQVDCDGLCTVYYPINKANLSSREKTILRSMASVMNETGRKYKLTGWADNYTGNDEINTRLRNERVNGVKNFLIECGVNPDKLDAGIDANNLTDFGAKGASLDRAVTITYAD